jgi:hypothetical protein
MDYADRYYNDRPCTVENIVLDNQSKIDRYKTTNMHKRINKIIRVFFFFWMLIQKKEKRAKRGKL